MLFIVLWSGLKLWQRDPCLAIPTPLSNSSDSETGVGMGKSKDEVLTELRVKQVLVNQVPCTPDGRWTNEKYYL